jgi:hypothetical protein
MKPLVNTPTSPNASEVLRESLVISKVRSSVLIVDPIYSYPFSVVPVNTLKDLKRDGVLSGRFKLKLEYDHQSNRPPGPAPTSSAELEAANAAAEHALNASKSLDSPNSLSAQVSKIGDGADTASTSKPILSSMYDDLQLLGPVVSPIGQALKSLDQIVNIIEGVAEVRVVQT